MNDTITTNAQDGRVCLICRRPLGDSGVLVDLSGLANGAVTGRVPLLVHKDCSDALEQEVTDSGKPHEVVPANMTDDDIRNLARETIAEYRARTQ